MYTHDIVILGRLVSHTITHVYTIFIPVLAGNALADWIALDYYLLYVQIRCKVVDQYMSLSICHCEVIIKPHTHSNYKHVIWNSTKRDKSHFVDWATTCSDRSIFARTASLEPNKTTERLVNYDMELLMHKDTSMECYKGMPSTNRILKFSREETITDNALCWSHQLQLCKPQWTTRTQLWSVDRP